MNSRYCNIVFQTHWDREWYYSFEEFRFRLLQVMEKVSEAVSSGDIDCFVLDGQVAALEDYLEVCEEDERIKVLKLIKEGKIIVGPWYVLADEFLVCGEALIRNLEMGINISKLIGRPQRIGYLPDTFGHISQMPQILRGFGISDGILWRGVNPEHSEFIWQGKDGTEIFTLFLSKGYYMPIIDQPQYEDSIKKYFSEVDEYALTDELLLTNGGDHLMPSTVSIRERIEKLNGSDDFKFIVTSFEEYIRKVKEKINREELEMFKGELRDNSRAYILPNVLSSRNYLKLNNQLIEDELTGYVEPLTAIGRHLSCKLPDRYIKDTWKLLMKNHPHDSICGCSIDTVHNEMEQRNITLFKRLKLLQRGVFNNCGWLDNKINYTDAKVGIFDDCTRFTVFNPHPYDYTGYIEGEIWLHETSELLSSFSLYDENEREYNATVLDIRKGRHFESPLDGFPEFKNVHYYRIGFYVEGLKASSFRNFKLGKGGYSILSSSPDHMIENSSIRVELDREGTLTLFDKRNNREYKGLNQFYSSLDCGDEYSYCPPFYDITNYGNLKGDICTQTSKDYSRLSYTIELKLPEGLNTNRTGADRSSVDNVIKVQVELKGESDIINIKIIVENNAKDQRLRLRLPLGRTINSSFSDSAFDVVKREANRKEELRAQKQKEVPVVVDSSYSTIKADDGEGGIVFYHRGLQEYQITSEREESCLNVTVIRSVGWLSRDDMTTRGGGAGPGMETAGAQCIGTYEFNYALRPFNKAIAIGEYLKDARLFRIPPILYKGHTGDFENKSFIRLTNKRLQWSSLRCLGDEYEIRLWNPDEVLQEFEIETDCGFKKAWMCNMDGSFIKEISFNERIHIAPWEIMTIRFAA